MALSSSTLYMLDTNMVSFLANRRSLEARRTHALSLDAVLVTHDNAFQQVKALRTVDWATDV